MPTRTQPSTLLSSIAHVLDAALHDDPRNTLVLLQEEHDAAGDLVLALRPLSGARHPCEELATFVAPPGCWAVAVVVHGRAHVLGASGDAPAAVVSTYLRHRDGRQVSLLRRGEQVTEQRGPVVGRVPDLCERILGPAPSGQPADP